MNEYAIPNKNLEDLENQREELKFMYKEHEKTNRKSKEMEAIVDRSIAKSLKSMFGEKPEDQRFINVGRIPYICEDINSMKTDISNIHIDIKWIKDGFGEIKKGQSTLVTTLIVSPIIAIILGFTIYIGQGFIKKFLGL